ncbi:unnamed protein product, partial [Rotaria sp. Silwood2]
MIYRDRPIFKKNFQKLDQRSLTLRGQAAIRSITKIRIHEKMLSLIKLSNASMDIELI